MAGAIGMVCNTLGISEVNMCGKMILIEEQHGTNANFLISAVLLNALTSKKDAVCLVLCHNTFGHYHNVGMRLGYNLLALKETGQVAIVEPMKTVAGNVADMYEESADRETNVLPDASSERHVDIAYRLFTRVREKYEEAARFSESVVLIVDDISHLLDLGFGVTDVMYFVRYLRSFMASHPSSQLCVLAHTYAHRWKPRTSSADMIANALRHMAHLCVTTEPFKTGYPGDTSGRLIVHWKIDSVRAKHHWAEKTVYLFKLLDWQIRFLTPGGVDTFL